MRTLAISSFIVASVLGAPSAFAQDEPTDPRTGPKPPQVEPEDELSPRAGKEEDIDVENPAEVERIRSELARIKTERARLTKADKLPEFGSQVHRLKGQDLSPVLVPRTEVVGLRLDAAIEQALANNPDYLVSLLRARSAAEQIEAERGAFDPFLQSTGTYGRTFSPSPSQGKENRLRLSNTLGVRLPTGTELGVTYSEGRVDTENPFSGLQSGASGSRFLTPSVSFTITQPLLRNFGIDVNLTGIRVAQNTALSTDADLANVYMNAVLAVENAYWNLVLAEAQLRAQERSLGSSIKFLDDQRKKLEHGAGTRLEVTIAKAGVANTREAVIVAENQLESARDSVIRLVSPSSDASKWDQFLVPLDLPQLVADPATDSATAIQNALGRRPDYLRAKLAVDTAHRQLAFAKNQVLPTVNFVGSFTEAGLGTTHHSAWKDLATADNYAWTAGFSVELPLFLRSERARARAAEFDLQGAEAALIALESDVILNVRTALRDVRTSKARIEASRASRILAAERLEATRVQVQTGTAVPRDVLDDLAELARAETAEVQAFINYRLSLTRLKLAQGILLDPWLDVLAPRVRMALDRVNYGDR